MVYLLQALLIGPVRWVHIYMPAGVYFSFKNQNSCSVARVLSTKYHLFPL